LVALSGADVPWFPEDFPTQYGGQLQAGRLRLEKSKVRRIGFGELVDSMWETQCHKQLAFGDDNYLPPIYCEFGDDLLMGLQHYIRCLELQCLFYVFFTE
jgi:hypothetical protein